MQCLNTVLGENSRNGNLRTLESNESLPTPALLRQATRLFRVESFSMAAVRIPGSREDNPKALRALYRYWRRGRASQIPEDLYTATQIG